MPKRTNDFQQLMHYIYSQMVPEGATVTESALLKERDSGSEREVDILIEYEIAGTTFQIAVECRDRSRRDSIEWIDSLIGKYRDLAVDKVVAVNRSGFSEEAVQKATANRIHTRTLEKALDMDWPKEFIKLGIVKLTYRTFLQEVRIDTDRPLVKQAEPSNAVSDQVGKGLGTLLDFIIDCFERRVEPDTRQQVEQHVLDLLRTLADLKKKLLLTEHTITAPKDLYLTGAEGGDHKIRNLIFHAVTFFSIDDTVAENYSFGKAQITS